MNFISHHQWLYSELGSGSTANCATQALAWQDAFIRIIPSLQEPQPTGIIHCYRLDYPTVLIGPKDMRLPQLNKGVQFIKDQGYAVHLRAHGGLAVISDPEIVNISFISDTTNYPLSINQAYQQLVEWVRLTLSAYHLNVESYEVPTSYCPGTYDIVVNQQKIGGIAQRRFKNGVATAAYISVGGNQTQRAELIREFYRISQADSNYPNIKPQSMATINDFLTQPITTTELLDNLQQMIQQYSLLRDFMQITPEQLAIYQQMHQKAIERNQSLYNKEIIL